MLLGAAYVLGAPTAAVANNMRGLIDDFAIWSGALSADQLAMLKSGMTPDQIAADSDADGLPDWWEDKYALHKNNPADAAQDSDSDGLTNLQEYAKGTNPRNPDTDGDGFKDGVETGSGFWTSSTDTGTDPLNPDTDGDGLLDGVETNTGTFLSATNTGTSPHVKDSDGDLYPDATEVLLGANPTDPNNIPYVPGAPNLLAYWDFNQPTVATQTVDRIHQFTGVLEGDAVHGTDGSGRTGKPGDRAMYFSTNGTALVRNAAGAWLSAAGVNDAITISFWEKWTTPIASIFAFYGISPSGQDNFRGLSAHSPWGDGTIYWDTGGSAAAFRISANTAAIAAAVPGYTDPNSYFTNQWRHFALVKNGGAKEIWLDGRLVLQAANTAVLATDFTQFLMGNTWASANAFRGYMDEFAIYASALTPEQIGALAQGASPIDFVVPPVLSIAKSGASDVVLTWSGSGFILQVNSDVTNPAGWADIPGATSSPVTQTTSPAGNKYYRLKQQ